MENCEDNELTSEVTTPLLTRLVTRVNMTPILLVVVLERLTFYSIQANLFLFFKDEVFVNGESSINSSNSVLILAGMSWLMCVGGGWISDAKLGKLKTLIFGLIFYVIGIGLLFGSACILHYHYFENKVKQTSYRVLLVYLSIIVALVGEGAYKANISPFGADQVSKGDSNDTRRFFNYYYFSLNLGVIIAFSIVAYLQQNFGFVIGYAIPLVTIFLALVIFVARRKRYVSTPSQRILGKVCQIISEARRNRKRRIRNSPSLVQEDVAWLDYATLKHGGSFLDWEVEEVRLLLRVLPVFVVLIPYWTIYSQMQATFLDQGIHMKLYRPIPSFSVPAAWLNLFNVISVLLLIPVMEKGLYPWLIKHGYHPSPIKRITFGILVACLSIVAAGFVEHFVVQDMKNNHTSPQTVNNRTVVASELSVFWQIPQYMLIGVSEVFAVVGGLEFAYGNAPKSMQSIVMAIYFATHSLGSLLGSALLELSEICHFTKKIRGHNYYDHTYYFFFLCVLMLLAWFAFVVYINHSKYGEDKIPRSEILRTRFFRGTPINTNRNKHTSE